MSTNPVFTKTFAVNDAQILVFLNIDEEITVCVRTIYLSNWMGLNIPVFEGSNRDENISHGLSFIKAFNQILAEQAFGQMIQNTFRTVQ